MSRTRPLFLTALALGAAAFAVPASASTSGGTSTDAGAADVPAVTTTEAAVPVTTTTNRRPSAKGTVRLRSSSRIRVRKTPTRTASVGTLKRNATVRIRCQVNAGRASGRYGYSRVWNRIKLPNGKTGYIPDASTQTASKNSLVAPYCGYPDPGRPIDANPEQGRCASVASVPLDPTPATRAAFVQTAGPFARSSKSSTGVPAAVTLAQAILESASGTLTAGANNYFGIKAQATDQRGVYRWGTAAIGCVHKQTDENESGHLVRQIGQFRMYQGMRQSFDDHGLFLRENSRYAPAFKYTNDPARFAKAIHKAGYATDPSYSSKLISLMKNKDVPLLGYDR